MNSPMPCLGMVLHGTFALYNLSMPCLDMVLHDFLALETLPIFMPWHGLSWYP
ncbi:hypothetical protein F383_31839 [Gossypium arboreum]|uniref:Uncharacterized protein n=1 Tax=Gossypium arboreum TaxID=29729 RepID=A0A0B0PFS5_GOSAR|nr:hypothetical protein F383_31839 [Gossypium arboreum]